MKLAEKLGPVRDQLFPRVGAGCAGKQRYVSFSDANLVRKKRMRAKRGRPGALYVYGCKRCDGFHLTRQVQEGRPQ